jgi:insertion element IS1 protein InsB
MNYIDTINTNDVGVDVVLWDEVEGCELDEMWSFVQKKSNQRWLWLAIDHETREVLAFTFGARKDVVFRELQALLEPFGINMFYTDDWGAYERNLNPDQHTISKTNTQAIERKNLTLSTRIKRLCRKTICFSKSVAMHDIVIGLVINILEFGWSFSDHFQPFRT